MGIFIKILLMVFVTVVGSVGIDRAIGLYLHRNEPEGLLFPPHSKAYYKTSEFTFDAFINSFGFRDREFGVAKGANFRVAAVGDSFTYGWGVNLEQAWPKVLERNLQDNGLHVEILNLGRPGAGPRDYADVAAKAIPLLSPDLVILAVLQSDDLAQSWPVGIRKRIASLLSLRVLISEMPQRLYPSLMQLALLTVKGLERDHPRAARLLERAVRQGSVASTWKTEEEKILADFNPEEKERYESIDGRIKQDFITGNLNPWIIHSAIKDPDRFFRTFDLNKPDAQEAIDEMSRQFARVKRVGDRYKAKVVVVIVPFGIHVSPIEFKQWRKYNFHLDSNMLVSHSPDTAIRLACEKAGLTCFTVTDRFRSQQDSHFFYEMDGHFNASGHQFYADELTSIVGELINAKRGRASISSVTH